MRSTWHKNLICQRKRTKIPFEVTTLKVTAPLSLVLDSNAVVFPFVMEIELGPEVNHRDAPYRHTRCTRGVRSG
jgi:hypothetical protein